MKRPSASVADAERFVGTYLERVREMVEIESPSGNEAASLAITRVLEREAAQIGGEAQRLPAPGFGVHLLVRFPGTGLVPGGPMLVLGHMDTVHPAGTLERYPFTQAGDRVRGPGVYDMKSGVVLPLLAIRLLREKGKRPCGDIDWLVTSDEEVGSGTSREHIDRLARESRAALVLEPSASGGRAKTTRKGVGAYELEVKGKAAHAGIEPEAGASAVYEISKQVCTISRMASERDGTTVNVGVVKGGTRSNVVAEAASCAIDTRFWTASEGERVDAGLRGLVPFDERCQLRLSGGINRGAMEKTAAASRLFAHARGMAAELGFELGEAATGGASDGNLTAALGCPTLDGLGPDGGGAHTLEEHVLLPDIPRRIALLAALFETL